jgi:NADH dehydrogenase
MSASTAQTTLVVGAGFAGTMVAIRLARAGRRVVLVDPNEGLVERTRLHEAAASGKCVTRAMPELVDLGVERIVGRLAALDRSSATLEDGRQIPFFRCVLALGSVTPSSAPGVAEHALRLDTPEQAAELHSRVSSLPDGAVVAVVGTGLTGLELATELAEAHRRLKIMLIGRQSPVATFSESGGRRVLARLAALGIEQHLGEVGRVDATGLWLDGEHVGAAVVAWVAGMVAPPLLAALGLPVDEAGRVRVTEGLRVVGRPELFAVGDNASSGLRMSCATAVPLACHAAAVLLAEAAGEPDPPMAFSFVVRCVSLGRGDAILQGTDSNDQPTWSVSGSLAIASKETILRSVAALPAFEARLGLPLYFWAHGNRPLAIAEGAA